MNGAMYLKRLFEPLLLISLLTLVLLLLRVVLTQSLRYWFVPWNLALAWAAFGLTIGLMVNLSRRSWLHWSNITLSALLLIFLPNTWYVLTDFVHVFPTGEVSQLYDIVLMSSLAVAGFGLGFASLAAIHGELKRRLGYKRSYFIVEGIILLSSFAIYLGRELRWNTWDVVVNPAGLFLDVSDRIIDPFGHPRAFSITALFFVFLSVVYFGLWKMRILIDGRGRHS